MSLSQTQALVDRLTREGLIGLAEAARRLGHAQNGSRTTAKTFRRWCDDGLRGAKLEHIRVGHKYRTSWPAVRRFLAATQPGEPCAAPAARRSAAARLRKRNAANLAKLEKLGFYKPRATASAGRPSRAG